MSDSPIIKKKDQVCQNDNKDRFDELLKNQVRQFKTGATRSADDGKLDYARFNDPMVEKIYAMYLHKHRLQPDGKMREPDNWKMGIESSVYLSSLMRHVHDIWLHMHQYSNEAEEDLQDSLCGAMFNIKGLVYELYCKGRKNNDDKIHQETSNI